ncbi:MAG: PQQ-binding-like beta-propeller repeat protein [Deltaproteobacteria bacterium]|nr:PQQ-binding-like beta-propeller repeat protein [Deltaproteobacteria bacterium]
MAERKPGNSTVLVWAVVGAVACSASCSGRRATPSGGPATEAVAPGPPVPAVIGSRDVSLGWPDPAATGPRTDQPDIDLAALPEDPALLPTGIVRWERTSSGERAWLGPRPVLVWAPGSIVVLVDDRAHQLIALDLENGRENWRTDLPEAPCGVFREAIEHDGVVFLACAETLLGIDARTGAEKWRASLAGEPRGPWFVAGGRIVALLEQRICSDTDARRCRIRPDRTNVLLTALDERNGGTYWSRLLDGGQSYELTPRLAVSGEQVVVVTNARREDAASDESGARDAGGSAVDGESCGPACGAQAPPNTLVTTYRLSDGIILGSATLAGWWGDPLLSGDVLVLPQDTGGAIRHSLMIGGIGLGGPPGRLLGMRLPSCSTVWELQVTEEMRDGVLLGGDVLASIGTRLLRIDGAAGSVLAESDLVAVLPPGGLVSGGMLARAGNSLVLAQGPGFGRNVVVLLDATTLRPWRVLKGPDAEPRWPPVADERTLVIGMEGRTTVWDLGAPGPPLVETMTPRERIARATGGVDPGELREFRGLAEQFARGGEAVVPALVDAVTGGSRAEQVFAVLALLHLDPSPAVDALVALLSGLPVPQEADEYWDAPPEDRLQHDLFLSAEEVLARAADARAVPVLAAVVGDDEAETDARQLAIVGLGRIGTPGALAPLDALRAGLDHRGEPWQPRVKPKESRSAGETGCEEPLPEPAEALGPCPEQNEYCRTSADGRATAMVADALGAWNELWLAGEGSGLEAPLFTDVTSVGEIEVVSVRTTRRGADVVFRRKTREMLNREWALQYGSAADREGTAAVPEPADETIEFRWRDLSRDGDGDGWTDLLEGFLTTDPDAADTDGDTIGDALDPAPVGSGPAVAGPCAAADAYVAAFVAKFSAGYYADPLPLFLVGHPDRSYQYPAPGGPVIAIAEEAAAARRASGRLGVSFGFGSVRPAEGDGDPEMAGLAATTVLGSEGTWPWGGMGELPDSAFVRFVGDVGLTEDGTGAVLLSGYGCGMTCGSGHRVELRCVDGRWYPVAIRMTWIS